MEEGWTIQKSEFSIKMPIGGVSIEGIVDRIDKHPDGRVRIIDYKSSDKESLPDQAHLASPGSEPPEYAIVEVAGKEKRWINLQLPLYRELLLRKKELGDVDPAQIELAYFNLPKAVGHTDLYTWDGFTIDLAKSASICAEAIIERITHRVFWPPAKKVKYDDFETLFPDLPESCIDAASFRAFMEEVS
jgi:ATP-dependent helicase/nuclease subunit B